MAVLRHRQFSAGVRFLGGEPNMSKNTSRLIITDAMRRIGALEIGLRCDTGRSFPKEVEEMAEEIYRAMWEAGEAERSDQASPP
jgi:hypothetical protein